MGGNEGPDALFERCLPEKNLKKNSEQNSDFTYEVTEGTFSNWSTRKKNIVSYYEPAKHRDVVDFAYTPECWQLGLSELKKLYESGKLKRIAQQKRILDPDAFLDLAKKGFYSF